MESRLQRYSSCPPESYRRGEYGSENFSAAKEFASLHQARRSLIDAKISAITSPHGLAPRLPLPWTRTLTAPASDDEHGVDFHLLDLSD
jgi:hypothetical protein